jgi:hypothetical protein
MQTPSFSIALRQRCPVGDDGMGTELMAAGLDQGGSAEARNLSHPERFVAIQRRFAEAGADHLITNTFWGIRLMLARHGQGDDTVAINQAAVRIAREAFGDPPGFVRGDIGPLGGMLEPSGEITNKEATATLEEQVKAPPPPIPRLSVRSLTGGSPRTPSPRNRRGYSRRGARVPMFAPFPGRPAPSPPALSLSFLCPKF